MRLQDLKDDLAKWDAPWRDGAPVVDVAVQAARRVAALYDYCAWCGGTGYVNPQGATFGDGPCSHCGGTGVVVGEVAGLQLLVGKHARNAAITFRELARYLFGEE